MTSALTALPIAQNRTGILLMIAASFVFAVQDGISRHLAAEYNVILIVMIRYWFFAAFVCAIAGRQAGSIRKAAQTEQPGLQILRGVLLVAEICVMVTGFVYLGLVESMAIFTLYPLTIAALSGPILGEPVGWRRWLAIGVGFCGILLIIQPGFGVFSPYALIPLASAVMFALYGLLTRLVARKDKASTSFFWTGVAGAVAITPFGLASWEPINGFDIVWMALLCVTGALGHYLLIKCYEVAEASVVQPFAYMHFVFGASIGILIFAEMLDLWIIAGAAIVIAAGVFTILRGAKA
ncbi:MAG: DMT family transporter [Pseudomonadota bacterium]